WTVDRITRRARLKNNSGSSAAHLVQAALLLLPTGTTYRGTHMKQYGDLVRWKDPTRLFSSTGEKMERRRRKPAYTLPHGIDPGGLRRAKALLCQKHRPGVAQTCLPIRRRKVPALP